MYLNLKWQNLQARVREKSVQRPLVSHNLSLWNEWIWLQNCWNDIFWCLNICKLAQITNFESFMKIGHCIFLEIFGQNWALGQFSRFFTSFLSFAILQFTAMKINLNLTCSRNLRIMLHVLCPKRSLEPFFYDALNCTWGKVRWVLCIWIGTMQALARNIQLSTTDEVIVIKCSNIMSRSIFWLPWEL